MGHATNALPPGFLLEEYRIDSVLGAGGFGITYKARDTHLETWVAIKEYFPIESSYRAPDGNSVLPNTQGRETDTKQPTSDYQWGLDCFLNEARVLASIDHPYVVRVRRYFRANGTAYIVMNYEDGQPLSALLPKGQTLSEPEIRGLLRQILPALQAVHDQGYLHRDLKPGNLFVRSRDHCVVLIDFGAAREAVGRRSRSITALVSPGYSPPEQYTTRGDRYGDWTDIYALGAVLYRCITGNHPVEASERLLDDTLLPARQAGAGRYSEHLLAIIDRALAVRPGDRYQSVADMQADLDSSADTTVLPIQAIGLSNQKSQPDPRSKTQYPYASLNPERDPSKRKTAMASLGIGLLAMAGIAGGWWWMQADKKVMPAVIYVPSQLPEPKVYPVPVISKPLNQPQPADTPAGDLAEKTVQPVEKVSEEIPLSDQDERKTEVASSPQLKPSDVQKAEPVPNAGHHDLPAKPPTSTSEQSVPRNPPLEPVDQDDEIATALPPSTMEEEKMTQLLTLATQSFAAYRLTTPKGDNALHYYQQILKLDPGNSQAKQGMNDITTRYVDLAEQALKDSEYAKARQFIKLGLSVDPQHAQLLSLQEQANQKRGVRQQPQRSLSNRTIRNFNRYFRSSPSRSSQSGYQSK